MSKLLCTLCKREIKKSSFRNHVHKTKIHKKNSVLIIQKNFKRYKCVKQVQDFKKYKCYESSSTLCELPNEVLCEIIENLDDGDKLSLFLANEQFNEIIQAHFSEKIRSYQEQESRKYWTDIQSSNYMLKNIHPYQYKTRHRLNYGGYLGGKYGLM